MFNQEKWLLGAAGKVGGTQYLLEYNVNYYLNNGYLEEIV